MSPMPTVAQGRAFAAARKAATEARNVVKKASAGGGMPTVAQGRAFAAARKAASAARGVVQRASTPPKPPAPPKPPKAPTYNAPKPPKRPNYGAPTPPKRPNYNTPAKSPYDPRVPRGLWQRAGGSQAPKQPKVPKQPTYKAPKPKTMTEATEGARKMFQPQMDKLRDEHYSSVPPVSVSKTGTPKTALNPTGKPPGWRPKPKAANTGPPKPPQGPAKLKTMVEATEGARKQLQPEIDKARGKVAGKGEGKVFEKSELTSQGKSEADGVKVASLGSWWKDKFGGKTKDNPKANNSGALTANQLHDKIIKGEIKADPNDPKWSAMYPDGKNASEAQKEAYGKAVGEIPVRNPAIPLMELDRIKNKNVSEDAWAANDFNNPTNIKRGSGADEYAIGYVTVTHKGEPHELLVFPNPEVGYKMAEGDLETKLYGNSRTGTDQNSTIRELSAAWVNGDKNNQTPESNRHATDIANKLNEMRGNNSATLDDTPIGAFKVEELSKGIAVGEGWRGEANPEYQDYWAGIRDETPEIFEKIKSGELKPDTNNAEWKKLYGKDGKATPAQKHAYRMWENEQKNR